MGGLSSTGYETKKLDEIIDDISTAQKSVFGSDLILDASSPDAQLNSLLAEQMALMWEVGLDVWGSLDPRTASGIQLDRLCAIVGVERKQASATAVVCDLNGTPNQNIQAGLLVSSEFIDDVTFVLIENITLDSTGYSSAQFIATETGSIIVAPNTLTKIETLVTGLDTVNNPNAGDTGDDIETDEDLRLRRSLSTSIVATSTIDTISNSLASVSGVNHLKVFENVTSSTVSSIDPHSIYVVIKGGLNSEIAESIANNRPIGTGMTGSISEPWEDSSGFIHQIRFDRPSEIPIYIKINVNETDEWDNAKPTDIKNALLAYLDGTQISCDDFEGYTIGDDIFSSDMYAPISNLGGFKITSITCGTVDPATETFIAIDSYELATFDVERMDVIHV